MSHDSDFLKALQPSSGAEAQLALQSSVVSAAHSEAKAAVAAWQGPDEELASSAYDFLNGIGELAVLPITEAPLGSPADRSKAMTIAVNAELELRNKLILWIDHMLDDKTPLPPPHLVGPKPEGWPPPQRRVCDQAYLQMRRLVQFGEDDYARVLGEHEFMQASEARRDVTIAQARKTKTWTRLVKGNDAVDGDDANAPPPPSGHHHGGGMTPAR